jgi:hypothetical protein
MPFRLRIAVRLLGAALLLFAAIRFGIDCFSSFHTEEHAIANGGYVIQHRFVIDHWTTLLAVSGIVAFALSFVLSRRGISRQ